MSDEKLNVVGTRVRKVDGHELVTGRAKFAGDMRFPGMVYGFAARSTVAAGAITRIGTDAARTQPGVLLVITGKVGPMNAARSCKTPTFLPVPS